MSEALNVAMDAKSIHPRPMGEWEYGEDNSGQDGWFCSNCNFFVPWYYGYYGLDKGMYFIKDYHTCPCCDAKMTSYSGKEEATE